MKFLRKAFTIIFTSMTLGISIASAHAIVTPRQAGIGSFNTFTLAVPSEKPEATVAVRIIIPDGLSEVVPDVKSGWKVTTKPGQNDTVTEINWTGGSIPADLRDEFSFSAQVPATTTTLDWKAYQTYADGSVVSWDQAPAVNGDDDDNGSVGPYSTTNVVNDLSGALPAASDSLQASLALVFSIVALLLAGYAVIRTRKLATFPDAAQ